MIYLFNKEIEAEEVFWPVMVGVILIMLSQAHIFFMVLFSVYLLILAVSLLSVIITLVFNFLVRWNNNNIKR